MEAASRSAASDWRTKLLSPRAAALALEGRYREAEEWLQLLLETDPRADTYCLLGKVRAQQGDYAEAAQAFKEALRIDPAAADAAAALARVHLQQKNSSNAVH